ncbi:MAG: hypothetical protein CSA63_00215 [Propionibacterium sp.]|nr:MAG: hypothetical protein CSA63_00215 [Propionibacterium sp.]
MSDFALQLRGVTKVYGDKTVLDVPELSISCGKIVGLLGENGAGKSTLIDIAAGVCAPTTGSVQHAEGRVGWCAQRLVIDWFVDSWTNVWLGACLAGASGQQADELTQQAIDAVGLSDAPLRDTPEVLSGGQQQRLIIARTLAMCPSLYLLDEPTVGLDVKNVEGFAVELRSRQQAGATIVISSHEFESLEGLIDDVLFLADGKIIFFGPAGEFVDQFVTTDSIQVTLAEPLAALPAGDEHGYHYSFDADGTVATIQAPRGTTFTEVVSLLPADSTIVGYAKQPVNLRDAVRAATTQPAATGGEEETP